MNYLERALVVRQPWVSKILYNHKDWEMRSRNTKVRGPIGLIEAGSGLIVGRTEIIDCLSFLAAKSLQDNKDRHQVDNLALLEKWHTAWVLNNTLSFDSPIPYNHPRGAVTWVNIESYKIPI
ncbi:hypothetical protein [Neptuniibacter sp. QD37_11]|uniref:hypothetical protein n=1 Tax=Neptuniibacter sp. QD37_11 TaxID=3398209 RepID=UPI0039F53A29